MRRSVEGKVEAMNEETAATMHPFQALMESVLEHCRDYLQRAEVDPQALRVTGDYYAETVHVEIALGEQSWDAEARAIDQMIEVRGIFLDDVSLTYEFVDRDALQAQIADTNRRDFVISA